MPIHGMKPPMVVLELHSMGGDTVSSVVGNERVAPEMIHGHDGIRSDKEPLICGARESESGKYSKSE